MHSDTIAKGRRYSTDTHMQHAMGSVIIAVSFHITPGTPYLR
jgi:hypothetical protein